MYNGQSYQDNSIVNLNVEGGILHCFTDRSGCCKFSVEGEGEWIYPNGSIVQTRGSNSDFYRTRGADPGVVNLMWTKNALIPKGVFCCEIPPSQIAYIGVYPEGEGNNKKISTVYINSIMLMIHRVCHGGKYYC